MSTRPRIWLLLAALCAVAALAFGEASRFQVGLLSLAPEPLPRKGALPYLALQVARRTSVEILPYPVALDLESKQLFDHPFLYSAGIAGFDPLPETAIKRLRRYLRQGGFLLLDDAEPESGAFRASAERLANRLFPRHALAPLARDHVIYKSFYLLNRAVGRRMDHADLWAVELDGRVVLVISGNDLLGAFARDPLGSWSLPVSPGAESQRELAVRLALNLVYYALCLDYKDDQVHAPFILERRRR